MIELLGNDKFQNIAILVELRMVQLGVVEELQEKVLPRSVFHTVGLGVSAVLDGESDCVGADGLLFG